MGFLIACLVIGAGCAAAWIWLKVAERLDAREIAEAAAESARRVARRTVVADADRIVRHAAQEMFQQHLDAVLTIAEAITMQAAFEQNLRRLDELAERYPMPKRPASPPPAPGEPWQLRPGADATGDE